MTCETGLARVVTLDDARLGHSLHSKRIPLLPGVGLTGRCVAAWAAERVLTGVRKIRLATD